MHRTSLKRAAAGLTTLALAGASLLVTASPAAAVPLTPVLDAVSQPTILTNDSNELAGNWELSLPADADTIPSTGTVTITLPCAQTTTGVGFAAIPTIPASFGTGSLSGTCNNILTIDLAADFEALDEVLLENVRYTVAVDAPLGPIPVQVNNEAPLAAASNAILARVDQPFAGANRFDTAARIAKAAYPAPGCVGTERVIIASGADANFPDALAASPLAGERGVPILLVNPSLPIPPQTLDALDELGVQNVTVIGGGAAVSSEVFNAIDSRQLAECGSGDDLPGTTTINVNRIGGLNRYDTARLIAEAVGTGTFDNALLGGACDAVDTAIVVSGENYPDALAVGSLAARGSDGCGTGQLPIVLTAAGALSPEAAEALSTIDADQVVIIGGTAAVSQAVENAVLALGAVDNVERIAGSIREETAEEIAKVLLNPALAGFEVNRAFVTTGRNFPDALAIGPIAGVNEAVIVLTSNSNTLGVHGTDILNDNTSILHASLVGGTTVLTSAVRNAAGVAFTSRPST